MTEIQPRPAPAKRFQWIALAGILLLGVVGWIFGRGYFGDEKKTDSQVALPEVTVASPTESSPATGEEPAPPTGNDHPLDPVLAYAEQGLEDFRANVLDYEAELIKRELVDGQIVGPQRLFIKVRNRKESNGEKDVSFAVYTKVLEPEKIAGREAIWVEDQNDGKMIAHEAGLAGLLRVSLDPRGSIAMMGSRYPICNIGFEFMMEELLRKGTRDRAHDECEVTITDATVDGRECQLIEVRHPQRRPHFDFYIARVFVDKTLNIPIRYAAYSWPKTADAEPVLEEEYTYQNIKLNVGLTEGDFDPDNDEYSYP